MSVVTRYARQAAAILAREGEIATLQVTYNVINDTDNVVNGADNVIKTADGAADAAGDAITVVYTQFAPRAADSNTGRIMRIEQQPNPTAVAADADVAALDAGDVIIIRGESLRLARAPEPDGHGLSTLYLLPADTALADAEARWR